MVRAEHPGTRSGPMKKRNLLIGLMLVLAFTLAAAPDAVAQDVPKIDVKISDGDGDGKWYKNPVVIVGGVVALFLLVALASRGGGTTVVKS
jgi:hypothetical protein